MAVSPRRGPQRGPQQTRRRLIRSATVDGTDRTLPVWQPFSDPIRRKWNPSWTVDAGVEPVLVPAANPFSFSNTVVPYAKSFLYPSIQEPTPLTAPLVYAFSATNNIVPFGKSLLYPSIQEPTPLTITVGVTFGYFSPFSEPQRQKIGLKAYLQSTATKDPNPVVPFSYYNWLSDPVRQKPGLKAHFQSTTTFDPKPNFPVSYGYYQPFSDPTRRTGIKIATGDQANWYVNYTPTADHISWWRNFDDPVRKYGLRAASQQANWFTYFPVVTDLGHIAWWRNFDDPMRRRSLRPEQQSFTAPQIPTVTFGYYAPLSEPQRQKKGISYTLQPTTFAPYNPTITFGYYNWWSEPQRQKKGISGALQPVTVGSLNPIIPSYGYYNRFTDPQRLAKKWLPTAQQNALAWSPFTPITAQVQASFFTTIVPYAKSLLYPSIQEPIPVINLGTVTGIINAFQLNSDTAEISVYVRNFSPPSHAIVSIEELLNNRNVADPHYLTSIQEIAPDGGSQTSVSESSPDGNSNTSIEEDEP